MFESGDFISCLRGISGTGRIGVGIHQPQRGGALNATARGSPGD